MGKPCQDDVGAQAETRCDLGPDRNPPSHRQWTTRGQRPGALALGEAGQRDGRQAGAFPGANLSLAPALGQAGGTPVTSAVTAQGGKTKQRSKNSCIRSSWRSL